MFYPNREFTSLFGLSSLSEEEVSSHVSKNQIPAKVIGEERNLYRLLIDFETETWASISGKFQFQSYQRMDYPAVGDWVWCEVPESSRRAVIHEVLARKTVLSRKQIGSSSDIQILAANVDYIWITTSINADLNERRLDRYMAIAKESGAKPIIVLTKADLYAGDLNELIQRLQDEFTGVPVYTVSKDHFTDAVFLEEYLKVGTTSVIVGSSGVGKSTLVNYLIESNEIKTQNTRSGDEKGKHTTTSRHLYVSRYGGMIIDTPGMRELQLGGFTEGVSSQFADIEALVQRCRFGDCQHDTEPGCAVQEALNAEDLSSARWASYRKLNAEVQYALRKENKALASAEKKIWKKRSIAAKQMGKAKRGIY